VNQKIVAAAIFSLATGLAQLTGSSSAALAQTVSVPNGTNLATLPPPTNTTVWNLQGDATVYPTTTFPAFVLLPAGGSGLTINGATSPISIITLNNDPTALTPAYGYFFDSGGTNGSTPTTLNLSNLTITGGNETFGGAIQSSNASTFTLNSSGTVTFSGNNVSAANGEGGAIFANGPFTFTNSGALAFSGNSIDNAAFGGAIFAGNTLAFTNSGTVTFSGNLAGGGGAIAANGGFTFDNTGGTASFSNNQAPVGDGFGGAIYDSNGPITFSNSNGGTLTFSQNAAATNGGAINAGGSLMLSNTDGNSTVTFSGNVAGVGSGEPGSGGAIWAAGTLTLNNSETLAFDSNAAGQDGGAIFAGSAMTLTNSGTATFTNNSANLGGAIEAATFSLDNTNGTVTFSTNSANLGGAIEAATFSLDNTNGTVTFSNNTSANDGGAIYSGGPATLTNSGGTMTFLSNSSDSSLGIGGGAIIAFSPLTLTNSNSGTLTFSLNTSTFGNGGAVFAANAMTFTNSGTAQTLFSDNTASNGGAIATSTTGLPTLTNSGTLMFSGNSATGSGGAIYVSTPNFVLNATGGTTTFTGNTASGTIANGDGGGALWISQNATLNATGGTITFLGNMEGDATANAIFFDNCVFNECTGTSTATFNAVGTGNNITFYDPIESYIANGPMIVFVEGGQGGEVVFDGSMYTTQANQWSKIYANTEVMPGAIMVVDNNAVYGMTASQASVQPGESCPTTCQPTTFTLDPGATLEGGVAGTINADTININGTLSIAGAEPTKFSTFTLNGSNIAFRSPSQTAPGSVVRFNTYLGGDGSPSDLLVLDLNGGSTTGTATIVVNNVDGGPGALITENGIELVDVVDGTTPDAFTLGNPELRAGAYDYYLVQGGLDGSDPNDWFLRDTLAAASPSPPPPSPPPSSPPPSSPPPSSPPSAPPPTPPPVRVLPPGGPSQLPPDERPVVGPEIATYSVIQPIARAMGLAVLDTLNDRAGDSYVNGKTPCSDQSTPVACWKPSLWTRGFTQYLGNTYESFASPSTNGAIYGYQVGLDVLRGNPSSGSRDWLGVYLTSDTAGSLVNGLITNAAATGYFNAQTGYVTIHGFSGALHWTHVARKGSYLDAVLQSTRYYGGEASTKFANLPINGSGFAASLEGGLALGHNPHFAFEPQAQVVWERVAIAAANDSLGEVDPGTTWGTSLRIGLRARWTLDEPNHEIWKPYVRVNYWQDWMTNPDTVYSGIDQVPLVGNGRRIELGGGITGENASKRLAIYMNGDYEFAYSNALSGFRGAAGIRYTW
jgi:predicted outer membrane repeat protein